MVANRGTGYEEPRWFDQGMKGDSRSASYLAGISLGMFLLTLESDRLSALFRISAKVEASAVSALLPLLVLGTATVLLYLHPLRRSPSLSWGLAAALLCSVSTAGLYFPTVAPLSLVSPSAWEALFGIASVALLYLWVQRAVPLGRIAIIRSFGVGAIVLGCLSMLTIALNRAAALAMVVALPVAGSLLLQLVPSLPAAPEAADAPQASERQGDARRMLLRAIPKLVAFLCYAIIFGNVHFYWLELQDGESVGMLVQLGAAVGSILCGLLALALACLHWGHALEAILALMLTALSLVALWMTTALPASYVFACLVFLNIAHKLMLLMMLVICFRIASSSQRCASLWAVCFFSFTVGIRVSSLLCISQNTNTLITGAVVALVLVFTGEIVDIAALYGGNGKHSGVDASPSGGVAGPEGPAAVQAAAAGPGTAAGRVAEGRPVEGGLAASGIAAGLAEEPSAETVATGTAAVISPSPAIGSEATPVATIDPLPYVCHLVAMEHDLTRREEDVLQLLARGRTPARIAEALCISPATARTHLRNIYAKLDVHSQQDVLDLVESRAAREGL